MSESAEVAIDSSPNIPNLTPKIKYSVLAKELFNLVYPYWRSEEKRFAWSMLIGVLSLNMCLIYCAVLLNTWRGSFYTALQNLDKTHFSGLLLQFFTLVMIYIVIAVSSSFAQSYLAFKWRIWLTKQVIGDWLHNSTFCKLFTYKTKTENPDQRISQDVATFTSSSLSLILKENCFSDNIFYTSSP